MLKITEKKKLIVLSILPIILIILSFILDSPTNILNGIYKIVISSDVLLTDYLAIGGLGATFINSGLLTLINIYFLYKLDLKVTGMSTAAILIIAGFAFFGKNLVNVWPIYIGGYIYSKYQNVPFKNVALITMFGTALSPLVNEIAFGFNVSMPLGLIMGVSVGILTGFILPPLSAHLIRAHDGYNLYNVGFTAGFIGTLITSLFRSFGFDINATQILSTEYDIELKIIFVSFFLILILLGYYFNNKSFKGYGEIFEYSGRAVTDFINLTEYEITLINMGIMGIIGMIYVYISGGIINGPIIGGLLTVVGFSAFGKHPKNSIPILLGVFLGGLLKIWELNSTTVIIAGLFGTTLAPIAGEYGTLIGILTGFLHLSVVMNVGKIHGGINLYNNGFSGGIVASILVPIIDAFKKED